MISKFNMGCIIQSYLDQWANPSRTLSTFPKGKGAEIREEKPRHIGRAD